MSNQNHPWCRDVRRDEAIRAAEDAAEAERTPVPDHRDLPQAVKELRERVARLEAANTNHDAPPGARVSERECAAHADTGADTAGNGLRTERVTPDWQRAKWDEALAIICDGGDWGRGNNFDHGIIGALVIWADKEISRLTAERDEAKEECERLRGSLAACDVIANSNTTKSLSVNRCILPEYDCPAVQCVIAAVEREISLRDRVAELERAYSAECDARAQAQRELSELADAVRDRESGEECDHSYAGQCREAAAARDRADRMIPAPAANAGGVARQEPVAWGVMNGDGSVYEAFADHEVQKQQAIELAQQSQELFGLSELPLSPLYAAPQPPRGWLTEEMRDDLDEALEWLNCQTNVFAKRAAAAIATTLARSTPPRVKVPGDVPSHRRRDDQWIAAIREAGGEVEE